MSGSLEFFFEAGISHREVVTALDAIDIFSSSEKLYLDNRRVRKRDSGSLSNLVNGLDSFDLISGESSVTYSFLGRSEVQLLRMEGLASQDEDVREMVKLFPVDGFQYGRSFDSDFDFRQNVDDLTVLKRLGIDVKKSELIHNGLPSPIGGLIRDTSRNPGRRVFRDGFVECIGDVMWVSRTFIKAMSSEVNSVVKLSLDSQDLGSLIELRLFSNCSEIERKRVESEEIRNAIFRN